MMALRRGGSSLPGSLRGSPRAALANASKRRALLGALLVAAVLGLGWRPLLQPAGTGEAQQQRQPRRAVAEVLPTGATLAVEGDPERAAVTAAVAASAGVHGYVTKQGVADPRTWHPDHKDLRQQRLEAWLGQRQAALADGAPPPPLPIYTGCQVYVNHLYRVIYLRHAKTASSSLFCHFGGCREGDDADTARLRFELLKVDSAEELERMWSEYFVTTFVRSPFTRAISSYRMMARQLVPGSPQAQALTWDSFCADPTGFADTCMADPSCSKKGGNSGRNFVYAHIQPQHGCLVTPQGGWALDFIGRVEHIDEDLKAVLAELEARRPADAPPVKPLEGSLANVNGRGCNETAADGHAAAKEQYCDLADYYRGPHAACFGAIRHHYEADAVQLQYMGEDGGGGGQAAGGVEGAAAQR